MSPSPGRLDHVVILGHTGSLGRALMGRLMSAGDGAVRGYASSDIDLTQRRSAQGLVEALSPQTVVIMAAAIRPEVEDTIDSAEANVAMAVNLARVLSERPVQACVYVSSASVYGDRARPAAITEETPVDPDSYYAAAKFAGERLLGRVATDRGIRLLVVRPCRMYGPSDERAAYGPARFLRAALEGRPIALYGDGEELRDHLYVEDAARLIEALIRLAQHGVFNLATGRSLPYTRWVELIRRQVGGPMRVSRRQRTRPRCDQRFDVTKLLHAVPGLRFTPPDEGMQALHAALARQAQGVAA